VTEHTKVAKAAEVAKATTVAKTDRYYAKVVGKALAALDEIRAAPGPLSLNEITRRLGLAKTSVFRVLHTLEVAGYLERDPAGLYRAPPRSARRRAGASG
jgi:DNA-binding IclR family transcriptional regulator